jgi:hypothetical protein
MGKICRAKLVSSADAAYEAKGAVQKSHRNNRKSLRGIENPPSM